MKFLVAIKKVFIAHQKRALDALARDVNRAQAVSGLTRANGQGKQRKGLLHHAQTNGNLGDLRLVVAFYCHDSSL